MSGARGRGELPPLSAPDSVLTRHRWIPVRVVEWVDEADAIMLEHGSVMGTIRHKHSSARWQAKKLVNLMVDLRRHERWELAEHVERRGDGWLWSVEYCGNGKERK